jgi:hypothetical protein
VEDWRISVIKKAWDDRGPNPMKRKLQTKAGKAVYAARKCMVEPVFGQIKQARGFANSCYEKKRK